MSRPRLESFTVTLEPSVVRVDVGLELAGKVSHGGGTAPPETPGPSRAAAWATLAALQAMHGGRLGLESIHEHDDGAGHGWVTVVVMAGEGPASRRLVGSALSRGDPAGAAVRAVLQACNRLLGAPRDESSRVVAGDRVEDPPVQEVVADPVGVVSHQLRGPTTTLLGYLELLRTHFDDLDDATRRSMLERSVQACQRLVGRMEDLLTLSRPQTVPVRVQRRPCSIRQAIAQTLTDLPGDTDGIEVRCPPDLQVLASPDHVVQIVGNYLDNALRHGQAPIVIEAARVGDSVTISVTDAGTGPDQAILGQAFARTLPSHAGTGLGLHVVGVLAAANAATVDLTRTAQGRTRASVTFPALPHRPPHPQGT